VCEDWSYISREEHRLRVFEKMKRRKIFWFTKGEVRGEWRRLQNEEVHDMYVSSDIRVIYSGRMRWAGHVARMGEKRSAYRILVERHE
jgi:hypothetical protein